MRIWLPAVLIVLALLVGCGQKGPLYRPDEAPAEEAGENG